MQSSNLPPDEFGEHLTTEAVERAWQTIARANEIATVNSAEIDSKPTDPTNAAARIARILYNEYADKGDLFYPEEWESAVARIMVAACPADVMAGGCEREHRLAFAANHVAGSLVNGEDPSPEAFEEMRSIASEVLRKGSGRRQEPRELLCMICWDEYPVWYAPDTLWNRVVRRPDGSDEWDYLCPACFARVAVERGVDARFVLSCD